MNNYLSLLKDILNHGERRRDRTGTLSQFGRHLSFDLTRGLPAVTTKRLRWESVVGELLWAVNEYPDRFNPVMKSLRNDPFGRRHGVDMWDTPCHGLIMQYHVSGGGALSCQAYQRSTDAVRGLPLDIAGHALLVHMMAAQLGYRPGYLRITLGDVHIYNNHTEQVETQLGRVPYPLPWLHMNAGVNSLYDYTPDDLILENYRHH